MSHKLLNLNNFSMKFKDEFQEIPFEKLYYSNNINNVDPANLLAQTK